MGSLTRCFRAEALQQPQPTVDGSRKTKISVVVNRKALRQIGEPLGVRTEACSIECSAMAAVSLGLVFVSSCNDEVGS